MTDFEKLDEVMRLLNEADALVKEVLGAHEPIRSDIYAVMENVSDAMTEVEGE